MDFRNDALGANRCFAESLLVQCQPLMDLTFFEKRKTSH